MTTKIPTGLRLPEETLNTLKSIATEEHRSFNNLVEVIIAEYIEKRNEEK